MPARERHLPAGGEAGRPDAGALRVGRQGPERRHHLRGAEGRAGELPRGDGEPHHQVSRLEEIILILHQEKSNLLMRTDFILFHPNYDYQ